MKAVFPFQLLGFFFLSWSSVLVAWSFIVQLFRYKFTLLCHLKFIFDITVPLSQNTRAYADRILLCLIADHLPLGIIDLITTDSCQSPPHFNKRGPYTKMTARC